MPASRSSSVGISPFRARGDGQAEAGVPAAVFGAVGFARGRPVAPRLVACVGAAAGVFPLRRTGRELGRALAGLALVEPLDEGLRVFPAGADAGVTVVLRVAGRPPGERPDPPLVRAVDVAGGPVSVLALGLV